MPPAPATNNLAVFNVGDQDEADVQVNWNDLKTAGPFPVRDLWERKDVGTFADGHASHQFRDQLIAATLKPLLSRRSVLRHS